MVTKKFFSIFNFISSFKSRLEAILAREPELRAYVRFGPPYKKILESPVVSNSVSSDSLYSLKMYYIIQQLLFFDINLRVSMLDLILKYETLIYINM